MNSNQPDQIAPQQRQLTPLTVFLLLIMVFFCAVLVFVFAATKRASPVMLDQQGHPLNESSQRAK
jgi:hypothetical protein